MTLQQELSSWNPFAQSHEVKTLPEVGDHAPSASQLRFPRSDRKPTIVLFLRHCGCPFAEKSFISMRSTAEQHSNLHFVAVSHSDQNATANWLEGVGGAGSIEVIVDNERQIYGEYGLGLSSFWHTLNPWSMASVLRLGRGEGIWNKPTESGSRWQTAGLFGVSAEGLIKYAHIANAADDLGDLREALKTIEQ